MTESSGKHRSCLRAAVLALALAAVGASVGCDRQPTAAGAGASAAPPRDPVPVSLDAVRAIPTERYVNVIGTLHGQEDVTVAAKVAGRVAALYKDIGDTAIPGELLLEIDDTDYELVVTQKELAVRESLAKLGLADYPPADFDPANVPAVQRAKLQAENAEAKFQRGRQLHEQTPPLISDQDFADFQTAAAVARSNYDVELLAARALLVEVNAKRADLEIARQMLADTVVFVPQPRGPGIVPGNGSGGSGVSTTRPTLGTGDAYAVAERMVSVGEYLRDGGALYRLIDTDPIKLRGAAPEKYVSQVKLGQRAIVTVEAYPTPFEGRVSRLNPQIDPASRSFQVEILIPNPKQALLPGGYAQARIVTELDPTALFVPESAIWTFAGVSKVFTVKDGKASEILVELGPRREGMAEVLKGDVSGGQPLIVGNLNRLSTGVPVKPKESATAGEPSSGTAPSTMPVRSASVTPQPLQ